MQTAARLAHPWCQTPPSSPPTPPGPAQPAANGLTRRQAVHARFPVPEDPAVWRSNFNPAHAEACRAEGLSQHPWRELTDL